MSPTKKTASKAVTKKKPDVSRIKKSEVRPRQQLISPRLAFESALMAVSEKLIAAWTKQGKVWMCVESCTGGAISAALTAVPGASKVFAGSLVTYQGESKEAWLGVDPDEIKKNGDVSAEMSERLAEVALHASPHVDGVIAVTGHFGPNAPKALDGIIFIAIAERNKGPGANESISAEVHTVELSRKIREERQQEAVLITLSGLHDSLSG